MVIEVNPFILGEGRKGMVELLLGGGRGERWLNPEGFGDSSESGLICVAA